MNFADLPARILCIRVKPAGASPPLLQEQSVFTLVPDAGRSGEFAIGLSDSLFSAKPVIAADARRLGGELSSGKDFLAKLANPAADGSIELQIAFFAGDCLDMGDVEIGVDEYVEEAYPKIVRQKVRANRLYEELATKCCYTHDDQPYFFFFAGPAIDNALRNTERSKPDHAPENAPTEDHQDQSNNESDDVQKEQVSNHPEPKRENSFCITGDGLRFVATETERPDGKSIYIITRMTKFKAEPDRALRLAKGRLTFVDWTKAGQIQTLTRAQMSELTRDDGSYLKKWDQFVDTEGELLLKRAREVGVIQYSDMEPGRGQKSTVTVRITQAEETAFALLKDKTKVKDIESLEFADELPEYLKNPEMTFAEFTSGIEEEMEAGTIDGKQKRHRRERNEGNASYKVIEFDAVDQVLTLEADPLPLSGMLILSLRGQIAQIKRRLYARKAILTGRDANGQLGPLIEDQGVIIPTRAPNKIKPLSAFVTERVFGNPPTGMQRKAIEIALNTPDIALIQGPPGTGKTTVITAIIERLNELADKRENNMKGVVLLTGLQHDAVENMIDRLSLNGLPVPKFGKRSGAEEDGFTEFEDKLAAWCDERIAELQEKNPQIAQVEHEQEIKDACRHYLRTPTKARAALLAHQIAELGVRILGEERACRAKRLAERLAREEQLNANTGPLLNVIRRLRHRPEAFMDDGPDRAGDALENNEVKDILNSEQRALLEMASLWRVTDGMPSFLTEMAALKKSLLSRLTAPPVFRVEKQNDDLVALAEEALQAIRTSGISAQDARSAALAEFLAELRSNPYGMMAAVSDYAYAFAATCQQSVNTQMQKQKGLHKVESPEQFAKLEYEYVIVDEAARVTPPDLLVAMAQGKKIILVGDHRQLPHIVDENVIKELTADEEEDLLDQEAGIERDEANWSKISLFEHMFVNRLPMLEEQDRVCRRVTLDKQYRMHPLLGDFVSRNFYERFDKPEAKSERFESGRPESDFVHNLPDTDGTHAIWLDVPASKGRQSRSGTSWIRRVEATVIGQQLTAWMKCDAGANLSFGVISFYKAQADLVKKQLGKMTGDSKRLRIGTVDSFQGMEFDVVFLSMVRTIPDDWEPRPDDEEKQARRLLGHLCLYNRLNVAMSRQKKLLVVVGDSGVLQRELAKKYIPGLVDFHDLCRKYGRIL